MPNWRVRLLDMSEIGHATHLLQLVLLRHFIFPRLRRLSIQLLGCELWHALMSVRSIMTRHVSYGVYVCVRTAFFPPSGRIYMKAAAV